MNTTSQDDVILPIRNAQKNVLHPTSEKLRISTPRSRLKLNNLKSTDTSYFSENIISNPSADLLGENYDPFIQAISLHVALLIKMCQSHRFHTLIAY